MMRFLLLLTMVALAAAPSQASAAIIFTRSLTINSSVNNFDIDQLDLDLVFADDQLFPTNLVTLFDGLVIDPTSLNQEFSATIIDPNFATVVDRLQDASDEYIRVFLTEDEPGGLSEKRGWSESMFFLHGTPANAPDLAIATIDSIRLRVDMFQLIPSGIAAPIIDGDPLNIELQFTIFGTVIPEPSTAGLLIFGLATLFFGRTRRPKLA